MMAGFDRLSKTAVFKESGEFLSVVRTRVDSHFGGRSRRGDPRLYRKAAMIGVWFVGSYCFLLAARVAWLQILLCISYALAACGLGFNVFHDAVHGAFSPNRRLNTFLGWLMSTVLGPGRYLWWYKHNILHHSFTNIFKLDDDLETRGHLRLSPRQPWRPKFRYQQLFFVFLYALNTLEWIFVKDFVQYFTQRMNPYQPIQMTRKLKREFLISKLVYVAVFVLLPFVVLPPLRVVAGLLLFHVTLSLTMSFVFVLAHVVEKADFPDSTSDGALADEWAAHQMRTTVNFGTDNRLLNWFAGGLNFQIEHHLFPQVSHTHYPDICGIVRRTASEFGLPYNQYETFSEAMKSHYRRLCELGMEPANV